MFFLSIVPSIPLGFSWSSSSSLDAMQHQQRRVRPTKLQQEFASTSAHLPFYTDPDLCRDRAAMMQQVADGGGSTIALLNAPTSRFVLSQAGKTFGLVPCASTDEPIDAVFFTAPDLDPGWLEAATTLGSGYELVWVGCKSGFDYFALDLPAGLDIILPTEFSEKGVVAQSVRQFADRLRSRSEAAVLATANGMISFHRSHSFCAKCGSATSNAKMGGCRRCVNPECRASVYPRIDPSAIMLVLSPLEVDGGAHALLGRKKNWPPGRYSTLAGFAEVGECMEECCVREVMEESGVPVDLASVSFVASQPWPFPRSLMVGFRAHALATNGTTELPMIDNSIEELEDVQWFSRSYVRERLEGGSTALDFAPTEAEAEFHIPGKASLARQLISQWANEEI